MANVNLALEIKKFDLKLDSVNNLDLAKKLDFTVFLNLAYFTQKFAWNLDLPILLLPPTPLILLFLLINIGSPTKSFTSMILSIGVNRVISWLKL